MKVDKELSTEVALGLTYCAPNPEGEAWWSSHFALYDHPPPLPVSGPCMPTASATVYYAGYSEFIF